MKESSRRNKLSWLVSAGGAPIICSVPMKKFEKVAEMGAFAESLRASGKKIGLVQTSGALHAGKESLIRAAAAATDAAVVVLFLHRPQFGPNEVVANYRESLASDLELCEAAGAACVFAPEEAELFPRGYSTFVTEESLAKQLCGLSRPNHFRAVATLMVKLFSIVRPHAAFFGQKTIQRAAIARKISRDLNLGVEIQLVPTVREPDGLAAGVRNAEFSANQRTDAVAISSALKRAKDMVEAGVRSPDRLVAEATHILGQHRRIRVIYVSLVDGETMEGAREVIPGKTALAISAWVDEVRLIDNIVL
jgi:pantoate--beta-alanine ligase